MSDKDALCANCGAHLENWRETLGEHDCKQPTDLFGPLTPPRGLRSGMCLDYPTCRLIDMILNNDCLAEQKDEAIARACGGCQARRNPIPQPAPAKSYVCNEAGECGFAECTAAETHTHNEPPLHGPRECGFTHQVVRCEEVPELVKCDTAGDVDCRGCDHVWRHPKWVPAFAEDLSQNCGEGHFCRRAEARVRCNPVPNAEPPLNLSGQWHPRPGVYFSGKVVEVLSMLKGMDPDEWDALWAMVTGKTARHADAKRVMREANGPEDTIRNLGANDHERDLRRIVISTLAKWDKRPRPALGSVVNEAVARIVELSRPETP